MEQFSCIGKDQERVGCCAGMSVYTSSGVEEEVRGFRSFGCIETVVMLPSKEEMNLLSD